MKTKLLAFFMMLSADSYAQSLVQGRVTDENDQALPGVNVLIKGTTRGTVVDANGEYKLENVPADGSLVFSFIGYASQEVAVAGKTTVNVKLQLDATSLQEVVVIGYGTTTVKELTGSVSAVTGKELTSINPTRIEQSLQGKVAGVQINSTSGSPGGALNIRIRGFTTNGDNNPLVLVDGVVYSTDGLSALNPSDIESINVLKDATAGIYGVQAANGVIIITTKLGKRNSKPSIDFNGYYGSQETTKRLNLLNATQFAVLKNEAYASGGQTPPFNNPNLGKGTDWQKEVFQKAPIQNYNLTMTGGSDKSNYSIGGSYMNQDGIVGGSKSSYKRYNARINFNTDLAKNLTLQNVFLFTNERRKTLPENGISSVLFNTINASPVAVPRNADGSYTYLEDVTEVINPLAQIANTFNLTNVNKLVGKEEINYKINSNFDVTGRLGYNYALVDDKTFNPLVYYGSGKAQNTAINANLDPAMVEIATGVKIPRTNSFTQNRTTYFNYNAEAFLNYNKNLGDNHKVKGTLGTSLFGTRNSNISGTGYNIPYNSNNFADLSAIEGSNYLNNTSAWQGRSRLQSYFLRAEYAYKSKYLLSAIIRRDASSRFGKNNRFGYFPSASAAWIISEESFFQQNMVQFLKLRGSYGVTGNDKIGDFTYRGLLNGEGVYPFNDVLVNGVAISKISNPNLKWETTKQADIGFDLNMLNDKVSITADYYNKTTTGLLFSPDISALTGAYGAGGSPPTINAGTVRNQGFEFLINYRSTIGNDLHFNIGYNITTIKNKVISLPAGVDFLSGGNFGVGGGYASRMQVGYPLGYFYGYKTDGVYQSEAEIAERGVTQAGAKPGDLRYVDISKNGSISFGDNSDKTKIGSPIPKAIMGLNLGLDYKGIDFAATFYASYGNDILRNYERQLPLANQLNYTLGRWTGEGSTNSNPRLTTAANTNGVLSSYYIEDGSFIRLKNIQLGYSLPSSIIDKIGGKKLRVYIAANNLLTITKYKGYDPDMAASSPLSTGIDYGFYPQARTYMVGLNLNF
ncbi:MAG TPA: TonB-dependent receptor [Cyclobacteriaceae bacterium]